MALITVHNVFGKLGIDSKLITIVDGQSEKPGLIVPIDRYRKIIGILLGKFIYESLGKNLVLLMEREN